MNVGRDSSPGGPRRDIIARARVRGHDLALVSVEDAAGESRELQFDGTVFRSSQDDPVSVGLVDAILASVPSASHLDLLIGGLGFGASLRHALAHSSIRRVTVVELDGRVLTWARAHFGADVALEDPRAEVIVGGFEEYLQGTSQSYHGIALDLDMSPDRVIRPENRRVYSLSMLRVMSTRLRSGGRLAIRASESNKAYQRALEEIFSVVEVQTVAERTPAGGVIYLAGD